MYHWPIGRLSLISLVLLARFRASVLTAADREAQAAVNSFFAQLSAPAKVFSIYKIRDGALLSSLLPQARSEIAAAAGIRRNCVKMDINIANNAELRANAQYVLASTRAARPKNTTLAYRPKQREFKVS